MSRILAVATNQNRVLNKGKKTGLWLSELSHFVDVVLKAGCDLHIASPEGGFIPLDENSVTSSAMKDSSNIKFMNNTGFRTSLEKSLSVKDIDAAKYDAIYLAGGHGTMWDFRQSDALQELITDFYSLNKVVSGVCHGVSGFIDSKDKSGNIIIKNKRVTGYSNFEDLLSGTQKLMPFLVENEFKKGGAIYRKNLLPFTSRVEVDGNLITGQNPQSVKSLANVVIEKVKF